MNSRYNKFLVALVGAIGTVVIIVVEQNFNLVPRSMQPLVMFLYSLAVAFGVRQARNVTPAGHAPDPTVSEAHYSPKHGADEGYKKVHSQRHHEGGYTTGSLILLVVVVVLAVFGVLFLLGRA